MADSESASAQSAQSAQSPQSPQSLLDLVRRSPPAPWRDGDNIPWHELGFSERMLDEHLSQLHDRASRRFDTIDAHVEWIDSHLLQGRPARVLDLGCGPGLYASRLARRGHACTGIDYSPAAIAYAREQSENEGLDCSYVEDDLRAASYGKDYGLALLIFGELNVFRSTDAETILRKALAALSPGGLFVAEPHTEAAVRDLGAQRPSWYAANGALFSARPHLVLQEHSWDEDACAATIRYFVVDAESGRVTSYAQSLQARAEAEYENLFSRCGFVDIERHASLAGPGVEVGGSVGDDDALVVYVMRKPDG